MRGTRTRCASAALMAGIQPAAHTMSHQVQDVSPVLGASPAGTPCGSHIDAGLGERVPATWPATLSGSLSVLLRTRRQAWDTIPRGAMWGGSSRATARRPTLTRAVYQVPIWHVKGFLGGKWKDSFQLAWQVGRNSPVGGGKWTEIPQLAGKVGSWVPSRKAGSGSVAVRYRCG